MIFDVILSQLTPLDLFVVGFGLLAAFLIGHVIENPPKSRASVTALMSYYRRAWMLNFVDRDPRIFDSQTLASLRQSTAFFGSTALIAIGGLLAMMGTPDRLLEFTHALTQSQEATALKLQFKLAFAALFLVHAFWKFVWSSRLFGYCAVLMAAVPNDPNHPQAIPRAIMAGEINIRAALSFNRGLRAMYFALASCLAGWRPCIAGGLCDYPLDALEPRIFLTGQRAVENRDYGDRHIICASALRAATRPKGQEPPK